MPSYRSTPHFCQVRAKDTVCILYGSWSHSAVQYHPKTYHSQKIVVIWVTKHGLGFACGARFFNLAPCISFHVTVHCLNKYQCDFGFQLSEVKVQQSLAVVLDNDIPLVHVDDKQPTMMPGVTDDWPNLPKDLEGEDGGNPCFIEPHLLDCPNVAGGDHPV
jgi:hypothetical protein